MIIVAVIGLIVNITGLYFLRGEQVHDHGTKDDDHAKNSSFSLVEHSDSSREPFPVENKDNDEGEDLNMKGTRLELLSDTIGSIGVIIGGIIIAVTNIEIVDPILSISN